MRRTGSVSQGVRGHDESGKARFRRRVRGVRRERGAFTLIELLIVIAILSLLVSILLPSLAKAKQMAKDVMCATNLRAIGLGWYLYLHDNEETFPPWHTNVHWFYGGKHPAIINDANPHALEYRPLNPYVSRALKNENAGELFRCPSDRDIRDPWGIRRLTLGHSTYDFYGNSYMMNWLLLQPINLQTGFPKQGETMSLRDVEIPFAYVAMAGDCQWYFTVNDARWDAHFHNRDDKMNILFLDGRAEFMQLVRGEGVTGRYSFSPYRPREEEEK